MMRYVTFGKIHSYPEIQTVLLKQKAVIDDLIDILTEKLGEQVPLPVKYAYELSLSADEYLLFCKMSKQGNYEEKKKWFSEWIADHLCDYKLPEEELGKMIDVFENADACVKMPEIRSEIKFEDKQLEKELQTVFFQHDWILSELLNLVERKMDYHSRAFYDFKYRLSYEESQEIFDFMLRHEVEGIEVKKHWLKKFFNIRKIQIADEELEKIIEAFHLPEAEET